MALTVPITEKQFAPTVIALAKTLGWRVHRNWTELHSPKGWPDLICCRQKGTAWEMVALELKSEKGKLTEEQEDWLGILDKVPGITAKCVRPSDWEEIERILKGGT